jgi:hypothetical protein
VASAMTSASARRPGHRVAGVFGIDPAPRPS